MGIGILGNKKPAISGFFIAKNGDYFSLDSL